MAVDRHWTVDADGPCRWVVHRTDTEAEDFDEVTLTKFSSGAGFRFGR